MMELILDMASWILIVVGSVFCVIGAVGLLRMPDFYSRIHASGITDTLGAGCILGGLLLQSGLTLVSVKVAFLLFFALIASPTAAHALAKAAYLTGEKPLTRRGKSA